MQEGPSAFQDSSYRRGVVLGLTIGEVILLLLFSILLALAVPLIKQAERIKEQQKEIEIVNVTLAETKSESEVLKEIITKFEQITPGKRIEDLTKEYVLMVNRVKTIEAQLREHKEAANAFRHLVEAVRTDHDTVGHENPMDIAKELRKEITDSKIVSEIVSELLGRDVSTYDPPELEHTLREMAKNAQKGQLSGLAQNDLVNRLTENEINLQQAEKSLANTKGQLNNLKRKLSLGGRGVEAVPCWSTPDGKSENIFDIALTTNGLIIRDRKLPHRKIEQSELPLSDMLYEQELSPAQFLAVAKPLYDWSNGHDCRFFVRAFDKTDSTDKYTYKRHLRYLGDRFYLYEELNEQF